jgi:alkylation response protein AidB-like acyl-CoA dehydrogenase
MAAGVGVIEPELAVLKPQSRKTEPETDNYGGPGAEALASLRSSGLLGTMIPAEYGGLGGDATLANRVVAETAQRDPSLAIVLFQHLAVSARIAEWGTQRQRSALLPRLADGTWLAASAWSETGAGADKKNLSTRAERRDDGWVLSGAKSFTTGAGLADIYLVLAQTDEIADTQTTYGAAGQTFYLVKAETPGIWAELGFELDGMCASATGFVQLEGCRVGPDDVLGAVGEAPRIIASVRESGVTLGAVSVGIAQAAYNLTADQLAKRGGLTHQVTRHRLVDLRVKVEAARAIVEHAGRCASEDPGLTTLYSKLFASVEAEQVCQQAQSLLGSAGYVRSNPINQLARDARAVALMGPTNDLCRELVSASWKA